jgi:hypothetical protein
MNPKIENVIMQAEAQRKEHLDKLLDEALEQTFPASDPVAVDVYPRAERGNWSGPFSPSNQAGMPKPTAAGTSPNIGKADRSN